VTARAAEILELLEKGEEAGALSRLADELPLFRAALRRSPPEPVARSSPIEGLLRDVRPDELTPREALELVYRLKALMAE
jgi:DNA mismatch repair protein MutS